MLISATRIERDGAGPERCTDRGAVQAVSLRMMRAGHGAGIQKCNRPSTFVHREIVSAVDAKSRRCNSWSAATTARC